METDNATQPSPPTVEAVVRPILHQVDEYELRFTLYADGAFTVTNTDTGIEKPAPWYRDNRGPWKVKKRKAFKSLVRSAFKDGDYDDYKSNPSHHDGAASAPSVDGVVGSLNQEGAK